MRCIFFLLSCALAFPTFAARLPQANLVITPSTGEIGKEFAFDASDSRNTRGEKNDLEYRFQFANDRAWTKWGRSSRETFSPLNIGSFRARVQVRDRELGTMQTTFRNYRVVGNIFRKVHIAVTPDQIHAGEPVYFQLVLSLPRTEDPDDVKVRWDFNSDGTWDTSLSQKKVVEHVFPFQEVGQVSPTAEVVFPDGTKKVVRGIEKIPEKGGERRRPFFRKLWSKIRIAPPKVVAPIVNVSPGQKGYTEATIFQFDASKSRIPKNGWLEWNFFGDRFKRGKDVVFHRFSSPGDHEVRVRTCYDHKKPKCAETILTVNVKTDPLDYRVEISAQNRTQNTSFTLSDRATFFQAVVGDKILFNANLRQLDVVGSEFYYRWDFEGDGVYDTPFHREARAEFVPPRTGNYIPTVEVQNEELVRTKASVRMKVLGNTTPRGSFTVDQRYIYAGERVRFFPKVGDLQSPRSDLEVRFDVDGDRKWDMNFRNVSSHEWRYEEPGDYVARMQVKDAQGRVSTIARMVKVLPYRKPKARVTISHRYGTTNTNFVFDASRSTGQRLQFEWDFDFRGPTDVISDGQRIMTSQSRMQRRFRTRGEKQIQLRVVDLYGNEDKIHFPVFVDYEPQGAASNTQSTPYGTAPLSPPALPTPPTSNPDFASVPAPAPTLPSGRPLVRSDMFYLLYQTRGGQPPYPGENPFQDVKESDWFFDAALQSHRDGFVRGNFFGPGKTVSGAEAGAMMNAFGFQKASFPEKVTREMFMRALR